MKDGDRVLQRDRRLGEHLHHVRNALLVVWSRPSGYLNECSGLRGEELHL